MNFEWIKCFITLAETENFSRAAELLKCSQPSVSRQIRLLEEQVKFQLFIRSQRHVKITDQGRVLLKSIGPLFAQFESAFKKSEPESSQLTGKLSVGSLREIGQSVFMPMILDFYRLHREQGHRSFSIAVQFEPSLDLIQQIKTAKMDFAVVRTDPQDSSIRCYPFLSERIVLVCSAKNKRRISDITELEFVCHSENDPVLKAFLKKVKKRVVTEDVRIAFVVNSLSSMLEVVESSDLFAAMPLHHVKKSIEDNRLRMVSEFQLDNQLYLIHPEKTFLSPLEKSFKQHILAQIKAIHR